MKPPWCYAGRHLLGAARSTEEILELLDEARCLSARARIERPAVIGLLERTAQAFQSRSPAEPSDPAILGWDPPSLQGEIERALSQAGYIDSAGWNDLHDPQTYGTNVQRAIDAVRSADVACWRCGQGLPQSAHFCGYCGSRLGVIAQANRTA